MPAWIFLLILVAVQITALGALWVKVLKPAALRMLRAEVKATAVLPPPGGPMLPPPEEPVHEVQDGLTGRRPRRVTEMGFVLMATGFMVTVIHDYAYRRADVTGSGDYEFGGFISHAGSDMLITTFVIAAVAVLWYRRQDQ